jgi:hypothetical protein
MGLDDALAPQFRAHGPACWRRLAGGSNMSPRLIKFCAMPFEEEAIANGEQRWA